MKTFIAADEWLKDLVSRTGSCAAFCVTENGHVLHSACEGLISKDSNSPLNENSAFGIYSITKLFTCISVFQLLEKGTLKLTDPISAYISDFDKTNILDSNGNPMQQDRLITIYDLLTMTSGIPYNGPDAVGVGKLLNNVIDELDKEYGKNGYASIQLSRSIARSPMAFPCGQQWMYGYSHDVLGSIVEVVSQQTLSEYITNNILQPCGMMNTSFALPANGFFVHQYIPDSKGHLYADPDYASQFGCRFQSGGGGLVSTLHDMALFAIRLADKTSNWSRYADLFEKPCLTSKQAETFPFQNFSYGMGARTLLDPQSDKCNASIYEFGWYSVSGSWIAIDRTRNASIVFLQQRKPCLERETFPVLRKLIWSQWIHQ